MGADLCKCSTNAVVIQMQSKCDRRSHNGFSGQVKISLPEIISSCKRIIIGVDECDASLVNDDISEYIPSQREG